jgi:hypothetical protein
MAFFAFLKNLGKSKIIWENPWVQMNQNQIKFIQKNKKNLN